MHVRVLFVCFFYGSCFSLRHLPSEIFFFLSFFHAVAINSVLPVRNSVGPLLERDSGHLTLQLPQSRRPMCATQKVESAPRCHGSGRAESRDFTRQWPRVLRYLRLATCARSLLMGNSTSSKMSPVKMSCGSRMVFLINDNFYVLRM